MAKIMRIRFEHNPYGRGWFLRVQLGPGAGYRWVDLPGYSMSVNAPWYRHLSISGRTARVGWRCKAAPKRNAYTRPKLLAGHLFTRNANRHRVYPGWW